MLHCSIFLGIYLVNLEYCTIFTYDLELNAKPRSKVQNKTLTSKRITGMTPTTTTQNPGRTQRRLFARNI